MKPSLKYTKLGYQPIDDEHEEIVRQMNELNKLISKRTEDETIIKLLDMLIANTVKHYSTEERLLTTIEPSPEHEMHILEHRLVIQNMTHFRHKLQQEIIEYQLAFKRAVNMWLDHMFKYDRVLVESLIKEELTRTKEPE